MQTTPSTPTAAPAPPPWQAAGVIPAHLKRYAGPVALLAAVVELARVDAKHSVEARAFLRMLREAL